MVNGEMRGWGMAEAEDEGLGRADVSQMLKMI